MPMRTPTPRTERPERRVDTGRYNFTVDGSNLNRIRRAIREQCDDLYGPDGDYKVTSITITGGFTTDSDGDAVFDTYIADVTTTFTP